MSWRKGSKSRRAIEGGAPSLRSAPRLQGFSFISLVALATLENIKFIPFRQREERKGRRAGERQGRKWPSWQLLSIPMPLEKKKKQRTLLDAAAQAAAALGVPEADEGVPGESPSERRLGAERLQRFIFFRKKMKRGLSTARRLLRTELAAL